MKRVNLSTLLSDHALSLRRERQSLPIPLFLTIPLDLPSFSWIDGSLEALIVAVCDWAVIKSHPERSVRVAVSRRSHISDLSELLQFYPSGWIQLKVDMQSPSELENDVREKLKDLNYKCIDEWTNENSTSRLIAYGRENQNHPQILFWIQSHRASHRYILLIPVN